MNIHNVSMNMSAVRKSQYPDLGIPEVALAGRSNVGKSSLINRLLNRRNFARVSGTPGKTATINFYNIDEKIHLVDLPGYGFARVSNEERNRWAKMINEYLSDREPLVMVIQLVDIRHKPSADDVSMMDWIRASGFEPVVIATKHDKLKPSQVEGNLNIIRETLQMSDDDILIPFSSEKGLGRDEVLNILRECCEDVEGA